MVLKSDSSFLPESSDHPVRSVDFVHFVVRTMLVELPFSLRAAWLAAFLRKNFAGDFFDFEGVASGLGSEGEKLCRKVLRSGAASG
jgi:hypothetical protein